MEKPENRTRDYFAELAWLLLLGNLVVALVGVLVGRQIGDVRLGILIYAGGAALLTLGVMVIVAIHWLAGAVAARRDKKGTQSER